MSSVPAAVAALIAATSVRHFGDRVTTAEATRHAQAAVEELRREGWQIAAPAHHGDRRAVLASAPALELLREYDARILAGLARGHLVRRIASDGSVPLATARQRIRRLRTRLGAANAAHAVALAYQHGLLAGLTPEERASTHLTARQAAVLAAAADGLTTPEIAVRLGISPATVSSLLRAAVIRLGATCRAHAVAVAYQHGHLPLLSPDLRTNS
ncbi:helix-turn-helix transcriptional regulator [Streptomyces liangshanensis]|uniref:helix-turn-helix transcriptional regulator n=1 Tax=Streptomyces liangshanensis TaxID=2717324 RepID=UPI0036DD9978